jgi:acetylornithine deacetylase
MTTTELLARLAAFDAPSRKANPPLIDFIRTFMDEISLGTPAADADCGELAPEMPGMALPADDALTAAAKQVTGSDSIGTIPYGTERGFFQNAVIPTIIRGSGHIAQAHQAEEWIADPEIEACDRFIRRLADRLLV